MHGSVLTVAECEKPIYAGSISLSSNISIALTVFLRGNRVSCNLDPPAREESDYEPAVRLVGHDVAGVEQELSCCCGIGRAVAPGYQAVIRMIRPEELSGISVDVRIVVPHEGLARDLVVRDPRLAFDP